MTYVPSKGLPDWRDVRVPLVLPINGTEYRVPPVSIETGALLKWSASDDPEVAADAKDRLGTDEEFYARILGSVYEQMIADDVPQLALDRAVATAVTDHQFGRVAAEMMWKSGGDPEALAAVLAATKAIVNASSTLSVKTGDEVSKTP